MNGKGNFLVFVCLFIWLFAAEATLRNENCPEGDWVQFGGSKCFSVLQEFKSFDEAEATCQQKTGRLASVKSLQEQEFLTQYLFNQSNLDASAWIGLQRSNDDPTMFQWTDGTKPTYTNWDSDSPSNLTQKGCVEMMSDFSRHQSGLGLAGKWRDSVCNRPNYVVCEKLVAWSPDDLQEMVVQLQLEMRNAQGLITALNEELDSAKNLISDSESKILDLQGKISLANGNITGLRAEMETLEKNPVPIGFIYVRYPWQPAPQTIWPGLTWTDESDRYDSSFFRVLGRKTEGFEKFQYGCTPSVHHIEGDKFFPDEWVPPSMSLPYFGNSTTYVYTGDYITSRNGVKQVGLRFDQSLCPGDARPTNMAITIWKRTA